MLELCVINVLVSGFQDVHEKGWWLPKKRGNSIGKHMVKHFSETIFSWWIGSFRGRWVKLNHGSLATTCHLHPCHPAAMSSSSFRAVYFYDLFLGEYQIWWIVCGMRIICIYTYIHNIYLYIHHNFPLSAFLSDIFLKLPNTILQPFGIELFW